MHSVELHLTPSGPSHLEETVPLLLVHFDADAAQKNHGRCSRECAGRNHLE